MKKIFLFSVLFFLILMAEAQVPGKISYQGFLTDANGVPVNNVPHTVVFAFQDINGAPITLLGTREVVVTPEKGLFTATIGDATTNNAPLPLDQWGQPVKIQVSVNGANITPSVILTSVPYAFIAANVTDNAITNAKLADDAVTSTELATDAVTNAKLAENAVSTSELADNSVTNAKLADNAITSVELATDAVTNAKLANNAVSTAEITDLAVTSTKLATDAVTNAKLADNAVGSAELATDAVTNVKLADNAVTSAELADNAVGSTELATDAVTNAKLGDNAVGPAELATDAVTNAKLADNAVNTAEVVNSAITNAKLATGIDAAKLTTGTLPSGVLPTTVPLGNGSNGRVTFWTNTGSVSSSANLFWNDTNSRLGINTSSPAYPLDIYSPASASIASLRIRKNVAGSNTMVEFFNDVFSTAIPAGQITENGGAVSYSSFTGSHYAICSDPIEAGMLVSLTSNVHHIIDSKDSEPIYSVTISRQANDPAVLGTYFCESNQEDQQGNRIKLIAAVGNGVIWVVDTGSPVEVGDYLISSSVKGHAMKNDSRFGKAFIVARSAEQIDWSGETEVINGVKHKKISVFFENFILNNQADKLEREVYELREEIEFLRSEINHLKKVSILPITHK